MRNEMRSTRNGVRRRTTLPQGDANANPELLSIPRLGRVRAEALAEAGITSLDDLRRMTLDDLARIKWIGPGNARLIKQWLETHGQADDASQEPSHAISEAAESPANEPAESFMVDSGAVSAEDSGIQQTGATIGEMAMADPDQHALIVRPDPLREDVDRVGVAVHRFKAAISKKFRGKKLSRQLKKVAHSVSDLPGHSSDLEADDRQAASEALDRITELLNKAVENGKLSAKKQESMGEELKKLRKRLDKALGG